MRRAGALVPLALFLCLGSPGVPTVRAEDAPAAGGGKKKREAPPLPIPKEETEAAQKQYEAGNYAGAVLTAKMALNKNEKHTPAMFIMAKAYYKLKKYEWTKTLWGMMKANNAPPADQAEMHQILAFMELEKKPPNVPGAIAELKLALESAPENHVVWNNLGAEYLGVKNYREAVPALEKSVSLQPTFAKAHLNLGSAYRGLKEFEKAKTEYEKSLQLFPNYADAVFNLGILYLDADKMPNMDITAKMNTAIEHFNKYKQMMAGSLPPKDLSDQYITEAQEAITKEQKRIERIKKAEEREKARAAQKATQDAAKAAKAADDAAKAAAAGQAAPAGGAPAAGAPPAAPPAGAPPAGAGAAPAK